MKRIEAEWVDYAIRVIPVDAPPVQVTETRRAFYAGAMAFLSIVMNQAEAGAEPTDNDLAMMDDLQAEFEEFFAAVKAGTK